MQREEIYAQLNDLFRELFSDDNIVLRPDMTAEDIDGWDSFNHLSIIVAVETRFGIKMKTSEIDKLMNVGDLVAAIESKASS
jgi:acyl carrier protein